MFHFVLLVIKVLREWNLELDRKLMEVDGHRLKPERLLFGQNREHQYVCFFEKPKHLFTL